MTLTGKTQTDLDNDAKQVQIDSIKSQLQELDKTIPRIIEDMITAGVYIPIDSQKAVITQKVELRTQLQALSS